jgi:hypothetical protein
VNNMLTSILDVPPSPPGTRIAYSRGEFQFGGPRAPSGAVRIPIVFHGGFWRARFDLTHIGHSACIVSRNAFAEKNRKSET